MSDIEQEQEVNELDVLKARADQLGIAYPKNVTLPTLKAKVNQAILGEDPVEETNETKPKKTRAELKAEALKLVRIRLTCMNPHKREIEGEIFTVGNSMVGMVSKYVPFDTEEGWHVPQIILNAIQERQVMLLVSGKKAHGIESKTKKLVKEFNVEILPPLTQKELDELARRQALARGQG